MTLVDSHCHLDHRQFATDFDGVLERAAEAGVARMLTIGTGEGPQDLDCAVKLAARHAHVFASAGVHPHDVSKADNASYQRLWKVIQDEKCIAVGEIGLDYHYEFSPREVQRRAFATQLDIARRIGKPVIVHTREAWDDTVAQLRQAYSGGPGVLHCFTGTPDQAQEAVELGFYLGFGGVLTFPKSDTVREAARVVPLDRILLETDAPYLAPVPHRGKRNEPAFTAITAQKLADLRECPVEEIARRTTENFNMLFRLPHQKANGYTEVSDGNR